MTNPGWEFPFAPAPSPPADAQPAEPHVLLYDGRAGRGMLLHRALVCITGTADGLEAEGWGDRMTWGGNPLDCLDQAFGWATASARKAGQMGSCFGGALHYDLRRCVERYPAPARDDQAPSAPAAPGSAVPQSGLQAAIDLAMARAFCHRFLAAAFALQMNFAASSLKGFLKVDGQFASSA